METGNKQFSIEATIDGKRTQIQVTPAETTDGVTFYKCSVGSGEITQIRNDEGFWKQIWGDLSDEEVKSIGAVIDSYAEKNKITS
ncbi:hypothetical protein [Niabella drilacis]|uniref:Uncharacterized protein n=1 Tax=Niabella drilacis (strain DSM 25811 / CCM 8410 / CCUG 62505 / LMG 26954 / E90) TaxID=1285928 RepID=A0A1G6I526_NIADE|nr:hypothetical protein [Niabella drilacis]SDC00846.1 hypothetical protein SAMN04487894_10174 [Niabella drilacis]